MTIHLNSQADLEDADPRAGQAGPAPEAHPGARPACRRCGGASPALPASPHIVCGQQLSTASAAAIWDRLSEGVRSVRPRHVRKARTDRLGRLGLSAAKIKTLKNLARELAAERLNLDVLADEDADAAHHTLTALHGIGPWTADVYLLFCLGHGDAWPAGDSPCRKRSRSASA